MLTVNIINLSLARTSIGPSVTAIGHVGPAQAGPAAAPLERLAVPWQDPQDNPALYALLSWHTRLSEFAGREEAMRELRGVGLSTPGLDSLLAAGKRAGALGGKLSGAGGGGAFFLVADSARAAGEIAQAVQGQAQSAALRLAAPAVTIALQPQRTIA